MDVDILVVGLGTAGSAAARACARAGLRVHGVDALPLERAGAQWVNGVPFWAYEAAGIELPTFPELRAPGTFFHMLAGWGPARVVVDTAEFAEVDMRHLQARLRREAEAAGARLEGGRRVRGLTPVAGGARVLVEDEEVHARVVIDASGLKGAGLAPRSTVGPGEICVAAQQIRAVRDLQAARAWFREQGVPPGETLCFTGVAGGFSVVNVRLEEELDEPGLAILTGAIPGLGHPSGVQVLEDFVSQHDWIGEREFGGARPIPLAPPVSRLDHGPVLLLGDSARQVYAAHGSGIAAQLVAARLFAERLAAGDSPWEVNVAWQRAWGGELAAAGLFARFSSRLDAERLARVMRSGLMPASASKASLLQRPPRPAVRDLPRMAVGAARNPGMVIEMGPILNRMARIRRHAKKYPTNSERLEAWAGKRERLLELAP
jgi:flavin-dependent dehydrogenase